MSNPCHHCKDREIYCHTYCQEYKEYEKLRELERKERIKKIDINDLEFSRSIRDKKAAERYRNNNK